MFDRQQHHPIRWEWSLESPRILPFCVQPQLDFRRFRHDDRHGFRVDRFHNSVGLAGQKSDRPCSPPRGFFIEPRSPVHGVQMPAKKARGSFVSSANHRAVFFGFVSPYSQKAVHGTMQRHSTPVHRRQ